MRFPCFILLAWAPACNPSADGRSIAGRKRSRLGSESATAYSGNCVSSRRNTRRDIHSGQNYYSFSLRNTYHIERMLSKAVFRKDYPENPKTFGEHLRKARIDAGLLIYLARGGVRTWP
ncbi:MAG: hypothetical protein Q7J27_10850 [Syntrophales bacterium]|nr:hypothetical protein [Syntrophales bacterium]